MEVLGEASLNKYLGRLSCQIKPKDVMVGADVVGMAMAEDRGSQRMGPPTALLGRGTSMSDQSDFSG